MAQMEDEHIFQQVDEDLAAEKVRKLWKTYKSAVIGGLTVFFIGLFAYVGWTAWVESENKEGSDLFLEAQELTQRKGVRAEALGKLDEVIDDYEGHGYGLLSRMAKARLLVEEKRPDDAVAELKSVAEDDALPDAVRDLARINAAYVLAEKRDRAMVFLDAIGSESAFRAHALEMKGLMAQQMGDREKALTLYRQAQDAKPGPGVGQRVNERIRRLGGMLKSAPSSDSGESGK
ncbi:MAG: tetratricopeptide repeat protein [Magnetococcales bacterium]|nr:tetratricopeptide repeat protein [Magnetococcales bacterium]